MAKKYKYDETGKEIKENVKGYISAKPSDAYITKESFKGEVTDTLVRFPKELGVEHPFNFEDAEKIYKGVGIITGGVNKIAEAITGEASISCKDEKSRIFLNKFINQTNFPTILTEWVREAVLKGNGFLEIDLKNKKIRVLNSNNMYVVRDKFSNVLGYNQWVGNLNRFSKNSKYLVNFKPNEIAHLSLNRVSGDAYGMGMVFPNERTVENLILDDKNLHILVDRKAGAPIHVKVGQPGEPVKTADIDAFKDSLNYLTNKTEWVTDGNVNMEVLNFGEIGKNMTDVLNYDVTQLAYGMEIPVVMLGAGNIAEGLAKVQGEGLQRKIGSIQTEIENIIEEKLFVPLLEANGLDTDVIFVWNLPGEEEINRRIEQLTKIIENFNISEPLKRMAELEIARLLNFTDAPGILAKPEKEKPKPEVIEPTPEVPKKVPEPTKSEEPQVSDVIPKEKYNPVFKTKIKIEQGKMNLREFVDLKETNELNYSDYLLNTLRKLKTDKFENLAAIEKTDIELGKLPPVEIEKLRTIFKEGFRKNQKVIEVENNIRESINLKDVTKDGVVITKAELRPGLIAKTETVRLANNGLVETYKKASIDKVKWVTSSSEKTCEACSGLDGNVYNITELKSGVKQPPLHPGCRCALHPEK